MATIKEIRQKILDLGQLIITRQKEYSTSVQEWSNNPNIYESEFKQRREDLVNAIINEIKTKASLISDECYELRDKEFDKLDNFQNMPSADELANLNFMAIAKPKENDIVRMLKTFKDYPLAFEKVLEIANDNEFYVFNDVLSKRQLLEKTIERYFYYIGEFSVIRFVEEFDLIRNQMLIDGAQSHIDQWLSKLEDYDLYIESYIDTINYRQSFIDENA